MAAAIRIVAEQGLGASTASIGNAACVSNGALFTYFETKADLLNQLYVELKHRMAAMMTVGLPEGAPREQLQHVWYGLLRWADEQPLERQALAQLSVSKDLTDLSRIIASEPFIHVEGLLDQCRTGGPMRNASRSFVGGLVMAMADATIDSIADDPGTAERHAAIGFEAMWRAIT